MLMLHMYCLRYDTFHPSAILRTVLAIMKESLQMVSIDIHRSLKQKLSKTNISQGFAF